MSSTPQLTPHYFTKETPTSHFQNLKNASSGGFQSVVKVQRIVCLEHVTCFNSRANSFLHCTMFNYVSTI
eukprot:gene32330-39099_t